MTSITSTISSILNAYYKIDTTKNKEDSSETSITSSISAVSISVNTNSQTYNDNSAVGRYMSSLSSASDASAKDIFSKLSIDMGGDSKKITKSQLDSYISSADAEKNKLPDAELTALKTLQKNWSKIDSDKSGSISFGDVVLSGDSKTLLSMVPPDTEKTDYQSIADDATIAAYSKIIKSALEFSANKTNNANGDSSSEVSSLLKTLLSGTTDENDDSNANIIDSLTNIMAAYNNKNSTVEVDA